MHQEMNTWFDAKVESYRKTGTSRTGNGRASLPQMLADMIFGPPKD